MGRPSLSPQNQRKALLQAIRMSAVGRALVVVSTWCQVDSLIPCLRNPASGRDKNRHALDPCPLQGTVALVPARTMVPFLGPCNDHRHFSVG